MTVIVSGNVLCIRRAKVSKLVWYVFSIYGHYSAAFYNNWRHYGLKMKGQIFFLYIVTNSWYWEPCLCWLVNSHHRRDVCGGLERCALLTAPIDKVVRTSWAPRVMTSNLTLIWSFCQTIFFFVTNQSYRS